MERKLYSEWIKDKTAITVATDFIKYYEGFRSEAYQCSAGVWTIGYGHTLGVAEGDKCTEELAFCWLRNDIATHCAGVKRLLPDPITRGQFIAFTSFAFNLGVPNLASSTLLKKHNKGDFEGAADEFHKWVYAGGKKLAGLVKRRDAESRAYRDDE